MSPDNKKLCVFLSYSSNDKAACNKLASDLEKLSIEVIQDYKEFHAGEKLESEVTKNLERADCIVCLISGNSLQSEWVMWEAAQIIEFDKGTSRKKFLAVLLEREPPNDDQIAKAANALYDQQKSIGRHIQESPRIAHLKMDLERVAHAQEVLPKFAQYMRESVCIPLDPFNRMVYTQGFQRLTTEILGQPHDPATNQELSHVEFRRLRDEIKSRYLYLDGSELKDYENAFTEAARRAGELLKQFFEDAASDLVMKSMHLCASIRFTFNLLKNDAARLLEEVKKITKDILDVLYGDEVDRLLRLSLR